MKQWSLIGTLVILSLLIWQWSQDRNTQITAENSAVEDSSAIQGDRQPVSAIPSPSPTSPSDSAMNSVKSDRSVAAVETWLDELPLTPHQQALKTAFGDSPQGRELSRMLILSSQSEQLEPSELEALQNQLQQAYNADFRAHGEASVKALESGLGNLSRAEYPLERSALIGTLNSLPEGQILARQTSFEEMTHPELAPPADKDTAFSTSDPHFQLAVMADQYFLASCENADQALQGTLDAIAKISDERLRLTYRNQLVEKFPEMGPRLALIKDQTVSSN